MDDDDGIDHIEGWVVAEDTESGKSYYANIFTQETSWDKPEAIIKHEENLADAKKQARRVTQTSSNDWVAVLDQESGQTYYFNKSTRETTWDKPPGFKEDAQQDEKIEEKTSEQKEKEIVFQEKDEKKKSVHGDDNKFLTKTLTVVQDENKEISKLEQYSDIFRQATEYNIENTPYSPDSDLDFKKLDNEILEKVKKKPFDEFIEEFLPKRTSWGKTVPNSLIMSFTTKNISKPISNLPKDISSIALQTFKNILSYCGERKSSKVEIRHAQKLIAIIKNCPGEIRDEVYLQLVKQITNNPNEDKCQRVWRLIAIISSCFPPTETLFYPLLNELLKRGTDESYNKDFQGFAKFSFQRLLRAFNDEVRKQPPGEEELKYIESKKQIMVPFYFLTGNNTFVPCESYSNAQEVKEAIFSKLELNKQRLPYYALYEICEKRDQIEERYIENHERIVDLMSIWDFEKKTNKDKTDELDFKMYLRVRIYFPLKENDLDSVTMYHTQMVYEVVNSRFNMKEKDIITLASLQLQNDRGDFSGSADKWKKDLKYYIPSSLIDDFSMEQWVDKIIPVYSKLSGYKKHDAKLAYLDYMKEWHLYLSQQYFVKYAKRNQNEDDIGVPENVTILLVIKPDGISLCDATTKEPFINNDEGKKGEPHFYNFAQIVTWGVSTEFFVLVVGSQDVQQKVYLETHQGRGIDYQMAAYTNLSLGKSIQQVQTQALTHGTKKTAEGLKVNAQKIQNRNATVFPKKANSLPSPKKK